VAPLPLQAPQLVLDEAAAARAWNWILARQGLADSRRLTTAAQVADAVLGLHAARLPSPYAIVAARTADPAVPASLFTTPVRASLLTLRCMRKTLHALPLPLAAAAHGATLRFRERDALRAVRNAGYSLSAIGKLADELQEALAGGPLPHRAIEATMAASTAEVQAVRLAVKLAWERGAITYINVSSTWNHEARTFALTAAAYPALSLPPSRDQAITTLVTAYFHRYGPATIRDATWWSGLAATDIVSALARSSRPLARVATPWSDEPCLMFADQAEVALASQAMTGVQFLAHEDTALKAYHQTRARYLAGIPPRRAFNQIGEALPTIIINGLIAGTWSWDTRAGIVRTRLIPGQATASEQRLVRARAATLTQTLRASWAPVRNPGPARKAANRQPATTAVR
jgi:winged helix DNA-binding protein